MRNIECKVVWYKDKKCPIIKLDDLAFDNLIVCMEGDKILKFCFPNDFVQKYCKEHKNPKHFTFKVIPTIKTYTDYVSS